MRARRRPRSCAYSRRVPIASIPLESLRRPDVPAVCVVTGRTEAVQYSAVTLEYDPSKNVGRGNAVGTLAPGVATAMAATPSGVLRLTALLPFTADGLRAFHRNRAALIPIVISGFAAMGAVSWGLSFVHPVASLLGGAASLFVLPMVLASKLHERWGVSLRGIAFGRAVIELPSAAAA